MKLQHIVYQHPLNLSLKSQFYSSANSVYDAVQAAFADAVVTQVADKLTGQLYASLLATVRITNITHSRRRPNP